MLKNPGEIFYFPLTIFLIHSPFFTRTKPTIHFISSSELTARYNGTMGSVVKVARAYATGTAIPHVKILSKTKVRIVLPPERSVK